MNKENYNSGLALLLIAVAVSLLMVVWAANNQPAPQAADSPVMDELMTLAVVTKALKGSGNAGLYFDGEHLKPEFQTASQVVVAATVEQVTDGDTANKLLFFAEDRDLRFVPTNDGGVWVEGGGPSE